MHFLPVAHAFGQPPPQSTSVSAPSATPSVQLAAQALLPHIALRQSLSIMQALVGPHFGHVPPPQSTSVSPPFFWPSPQPGATHTFVALHTMLAQSLPDRHS